MNFQFPSNGPFIIAEMSGNHNQSIGRAREIILAASQTGAHAVKLQTYTADTMTMKGAYTITDKTSLWAGQELHDLYQLAYTPWEWHRELFEYAQSLGMICFSTPFDETAVDFLETLDCPLYKIASFENTHLPLLKYVAQKGKPVIMSTGVINSDDLEESVDVILSNGCSDLTLLKCTSSYPSSPENSNIVTIPALQKMFPACRIGLSDHTMGIGVAVASIALGALVVEKHFTLNRADGGVDSAFSMEPAEMKMLVEESQKAFAALGHVQLDIQEVEKKSLFYKRSVYSKTDIAPGELFTKENLCVIRPALGLSPRYFEIILGKTAKEDIKPGTPINEGMY